MPLYEYECDACGRRFELIRRFSDPPLEACPHCGRGPVRKQLSSPAFQFKGSGWYITDYARKDQKDQSGDSAKAEAASKDAPAGESGAKPEKTDASSTAPATGASPAKTTPEKSS